jgi:SAM-dependent methyltransferase
VRLEDKVFERRYGLDTDGVVEPAALTVAHGDASTGFTYVATPVRVARSWLRAIPGVPPSFTFVDMGSGKGRVLALAAAHGFGRVIGVEFAAELHTAAIANAQRARERGLVFEPVLGDAAAFEFPDEPLIVHFNNPFAEPVMEQVISNLTRTYERVQRPLVVVYQQQTREDPQHDTSNLHLLAAVTFLEPRPIEPTRVLDRVLLADYTIRAFETPEAAALAPTR